MVIRKRIRKHEVGLWFRHGDFAGPLSSGVHWFAGSLVNPRANRVDVLSTLDIRLRHALLKVMVTDPALRAMLEIVELSAEQRALIWKDGSLAEIVGPGLHAFWKRPATLRVEVFDISSQRFDHSRIEAVLALPESRAWLEVVEVPQGFVALHFVNGRLAESLAEGKHVFWKGGGTLRHAHIDLREKVADVAGQEIMTSDKVTLRVNLVATYQVNDPVIAATRVSDADQSLYREAQLALRAVVGSRTLEALLSDKESMGNEVRNIVASRAAEFGVVLRSVGLRDIILPGEMKTILNRVIEAQKAAEADLITRREETAAARSQANTAKLLADNPMLARLRELELLRGVLAGTKATFVFAPGSIADQVRSLVTAPGKEPE